MFGYFRAMYYDIQTDSIVCTDEMENFLLISETLFSENCIVHSDGERVYPGTIDIDKFTQDNLDKCYINSDRRISLIIAGKTIGDELYSPVEINKPIQLYNKGEITFTTLKIQVEEVVC